MRVQEFLHESVTGQQMLATFRTYKHHRSDRNPARDRYISAHTWGVKMVDPAKLPDPEMVDDDPFNRIVDIDPDQVEYNMQLMRDHQKIDPVILGPNGAVIDGNHRVVAARHMGQTLLAYVPHEITTEAPLADYQPLGDFNKPGPFRGPDKKLIPHPVNQLKTQQFLSNSPYDFRLFFSNIPGTGNYSEYGPMTPEKIQQIFTKDADQIVNGSADAITIVYVGNKGDAKKMLTPWIMAHRFGHAVQSGHRRAAPMGGKESGAWPDAEEYFFSTVNQLLDRAYGKTIRNQGRRSLNWDLTPEYNALFNALGTQRSSRSGAIRRPYEFLYELFAQYIKDGKITLNPLPTNLGYGKQAWGNPSKYMNLKPEYRDQDTRQYEAQGLADDLSDYFAEVLRSAVGQIYVM